MRKQIIRVTQSAPAWEQGHALDPQLRHRLEVGAEVPAPLLVGPVVGAQAFVPPFNAFEPDGRERSAVDDEAAMVGIGDRPAAAVGRVDVAPQVNGLHEV